MDTSTSIRRSQTAAKESPGSRSLLRRRVSWVSRDAKRNSVAATELSRSKAPYEREMFLAILMNSRRLVVNFGCSVMMLHIIVLLATLGR